MLFVALGKARGGNQKERIARRMAWQSPQLPGAEVVAEYWLHTDDPHLIVVFKAEHIGQMWAAFGDWDDLLQISVYPAISAEEGLEVLKQMLPQ